MSVIAVAVATAICGVSMVFNLPDSPAAHFGTAQQLISIRSTDAVELGAYVASTLQLRSGRLPLVSGEVAVTHQVAKTFGAQIGGSVMVGGSQRAVVGLVENPYDLGDEFVPLPPADLSGADSVTVLSSASRVQLDAYRNSPGRTNVELRGSDVSKAAAAGTLAASTVVFLLVTLVAAAGFAVVAQRRIRQLGMLAAVGATDRHLVGIAATVGGAVIGLAGWFMLAHRIEGAAGHRISALNLPWPLLVGALIAGVVVPIAAASWPARAMARQPIVDAISARPPQPRRADTSVALAATFLAGGVVLTGLSNQHNALFPIAGMIALVCGILFGCPTAIRLVARIARRTPVAIRVALRDLGRYQARAGAALAAISLALGIPIAIVLVATAADRSAVEAAGNGNLADSQLIIQINRADNPPDPPSAPNLTPAELATIQATITDLATTLHNSTVVP